MQQRWLIISFVLMCFLWPATTSFALVISEVCPAPQNNESEWIEIYNNTTQDVSLDNWQIYDKLSSPSLLTTLTGQLNSGQLLVINLPSQKLNNDGDAVRLYDPELKLVDEFEFAATSPGGCWSRQLPATSIVLANPSPNQLWQSQASPIPSPSPTISPSPIPTPTPTPTPPPSPYPNQLKPILSEVYACPTTGENEWIELHNPYAELISMQSWRIGDEANHWHTFSLSLAPSSWQAVDLNTAIFNNSGDTIYLYDNNNVLIWQYQLPACSSGQSLILINQEFVVGAPTKNKSNPNQTAIPSPTPSSNQAATADSDANEDSSIPTNSDANSTKQTTSITSQSVSKHKLYDDKNIIDTSSNFIASSSNSLLPKKMTTSQQVIKTNSNLPVYWLLFFTVLTSILLAVGWLLRSGHEYLPTWLANKISQLPKLNYLNRQPGWQKLSDILDE